MVLSYPIAHRYVLTVTEHVQLTEYIGNVYFYRNGEYVGSQHNNLTSVGDDALNDRLFNSSWAGAVWNYIAIGTGTDDGNPLNNVALVTELDRQLAEFYKPADAQWGLNYTFTFAGSSTIKEAGILNAAASGLLAFYVGNLTVGVTSADTLKICWKGTTSGNA